MAIVKLSIGGRIYQMSCEDGQEAHLHRIGEHLDEKARILAANVGRVNESLMLAMVAAMACDELFAYRASVEKEKAGAPCVPAAEAVKAMNDATMRIYQAIEEIKA